MDEGAEGDAVGPAAREVRDLDFLQQKVEVTVSAQGSISCKHTLRWQHLSRIKDLSSQIQPL